MSNNNLNKLYFTSQELANLKLNSLPNTKAGVLYQAKKQYWNSRPRSGRGGGVEYELASMPADVQAEIYLKLNREQMKTAPKSVIGSTTNDKYCRELLWQRYEATTFANRDTAHERYYIVSAIDDLIRSGTKKKDAFSQINASSGIPVKTLIRWYYRVYKFDRSDWAPLLLDKKNASRPNAVAQFTPEAWEFFKADYLRPERPQFGSCYERLKVTAKEHGWIIPSVSSVKRKIKRELPNQVVVMAREGEHKVSQLYPAQTRTVETLEALEWINGDGYRHNVFVKMPDGSIVRPVSWIWQDVRTRKILAYRADISENSDVIRLALMDVVYKYGIPRNITIDNTRAAANKWMTGRSETRKRFKNKGDDPIGIIPSLGIKLHWTSILFGKGHGQAKPVERAFSHGGLGELVDKHPSLAGFYAGANVYDKPDNYNGGKDGVDYSTFITALEDGIRTFNEREGRHTELGMGIFSFEQLWQRDYSEATVRKASTEQLRAMLLMAEATTLKPDGTFTLSVGGTVRGRKNRYLASDLIGGRLRKVVVRFDPQDLHGKVYVYDLNGLFLAEAVCQEAAAFGDKAKGREHDLARKQFVKATKKATKAKIKMNVQEVAQLMPVREEQEDVEPAIIQLIKQGNTVRKVEVLAVEDEDIEDENSIFQRINRGLNRLKQERGLK